MLPAGGLFLLFSLLTLNAVRKYQKDKNKPVE